MKSSEILKVRYLYNKAPNSSSEELVNVFTSEVQKGGHNAVYERIRIIKYSGIITKGIKEFAKKYACATIHKIVITLMAVKIDASCVLNVIHIVIARKKEKFNSNINHTISSK